MMKSTKLPSILLFCLVTVFACPPAQADAPRPAKANDADRCWHFWPKIKVSKETTYFIGPLRADGGVDYVAAFNRRCSEGVTPENNACVALWRAWGANDLDKNIRKPYFKLLGIADLPQKGDYLTLYDDFPEYKAAERQPEKMHEFITKTWQDHSAAVKGPWSQKDYPLWAQILQRNEKLLDALDEGLRRPRFYSPLIPPVKELGLLLSCNSTAYWNEASYAIRLLILRAMLRIHDGDVAGAENDILAIYRLGRLTCQDALMSCSLCFGLNCDEMAGEATVVLSRQEGFTAAQARQFQKELAHLPAMRSLGDFYDEGERCVALEQLAILAIGTRPGLFFDNGAVLDRMMKPSWPHGEQEPKRRTEAYKRLAAKNDVDWTEVFRQYNLFQNRLVRACSGSADARTVAAVEKLEAEAEADANDTVNTVLSGNPSKVAEMSRALKAKHIARLAVLPGRLYICRIYVPIEQRCEAWERMVTVALALAGYRADHHEYPATLAELVPAYIGELPKDPFADSELRYKRENGRYLLYSVGENGRDDGGRNENEYPAAEQRRARDWDDISIRIPTKRAK
jgi:hypothetical protein